MSEGEENNVKVMVRVRPFNSRETTISANKKDLLRACIKMREKTCAVVEYEKDDKGFTQEHEREAFQFDECFWSMPMQQQASAMDFADQKYVYDRSGLKALQASFDGYNICIFAYGQTGSGKTHSMLGNDEDPGISLRLVDDLFQRIEDMQLTNPMTKVTVECMFYEVYNEKVRDLFNKKAAVGDEHSPKIRQHPTRGVFVDGLIRKEVTTAATTKRFIERGTKERASAETKMNSRSSRSHAIFQIQITQNDATKGTQRVSSINLVDLAGSEKVKQSLVTGQAFVEAKNINQSLSTLRRVFDVLIDNSGKPKKHQRLPPFRDSVLTYCLSDSLGGNSRTIMIATISPHESNIEDTLGTLRYALKAKAIVCTAKVNEEKSAAMMDAMRDEILALQVKLRSGDGKGGGAMSEEIRQEIELREAEVKKIETTNQEMRVLVEEAERKQEEMEQRINELGEARNELDVEMQKQKRERFAAAFRNAFLITVEKKKQATTQAEVGSLQKANTELENQRVFLEQELDTARGALDELQESTERQVGQFVGEVKQRDQLIAQLKRQVANQKEELDYMRTHNETLQSKATGLEASKDELQRRVQRLQEEVLAANAQVDKERAEKARLGVSFEEKLSSVQDELDNMRKRRDKYKALFLESQAKTDAHKAIIDALQEDRGGYLAALKSQQQVVAEQSAMNTRIITDRKAAEERLDVLRKRLHEREADARVAGEALREYQAAAAEWMYENHAMKSELDRVSKSYSDLRDSPRTPARSVARSAIASPQYADPTASPARTPGRAPSPSASRTPLLR